MTIKMLRKRLEDDMIIATDVIAAFRTNLESNPLNALGWSEDVFRHAAKHAVASTILVAINAGDERLLAYAQSNVLNGAQFPKQSTSPVSNFASQCEVQAWAEYLRLIEKVQR